MRDIVNDMPAKARSWRLELLNILEKATPAIPLSKADDNEISQSGISELLDPRFSLCAVSNLLRERDVEMVRGDALIKGYL
jgi:hypothetical protein